MKKRRDIGVLTVRLPTRMILALRAEAAVARRSVSNYVGLLLDAPRVPPPQDAKKAETL